MVETRSLGAGGRTTACPTHPPSQLHSFVTVIRSGVTPDETDCRWLKFLSIPHPRTDSAILVAFDSGSRLFELITIDDPLTTVLVNDFSVGSTIYLASPLNPVFLLIPQLFRNGTRFLSLNDLLEAARLEFVAVSKDLIKQSSLIADTKVFSGTLVFRLNEEKLLKWLQDKVKAVSSVLRQQSESISSGDSLRLACGIVADYLPAHLKEKLEELLGCPAKNQSDCSSSDLSGDFFKKTKSTEENKMAKEPKKTVSQKRLEKASVGTKTLDLFLSKRL